MFICGSIFFSKFKVLGADVGGFGGKVLRLLMELDDEVEFEFRCNPQNEFKCDVPVREGAHPVVDYRERLLRASIPSDVRVC